MEKADLSTGARRGLGTAFASSARGEPWLFTPNHEL